MKKLFLSLLALCLLLNGCTGQTSGYETDFFAMDTLMSLRLYGAQDAQSLSGSILREITALEQQLSVTIADSEVSRLNEGQTLTPSEPLSDLLVRTQALSERTKGCLDPTIYPALHLWGFTTGEYRVPGEKELEEALAKTGFSHLLWEGDTLTLCDGAQLDFGAAAKGYASECCAALIARENCSGILTLGGNIQTVGEKPDGTPWSIGITDPAQPEQCIATLLLQGTQSIVTSGGYQRYFEQDGVRYSHIIDPATGKSAQAGLDSVTIVADSGFLADGLSTALYVMGLEEATRFWQASSDFEMVLITQEGRIYVSEALAPSFSCEKDFQVIKR